MKGIIVYIIDNSVQALLTFYYFFSTQLINRDSMG